MTPNLTDRPFAARVAEAYPELWAKYVVAVRAEKWNGHSLRDLTPLQRVLLLGAEREKNDEG